MKMIITGANGLLGQPLCRQLTDQGHQVIAIGRGAMRFIPPATSRFFYFDLDIRDQPAWLPVMKAAQADLLIHAAALTQVDYCEQHRTEAWETNVEATAAWLKAAEQLKQRMIYISTDFVFDGKQGMYREDDETCPVNYYGETKLAAEQLVRRSSLDWAIVRTCLVYGRPEDGTRPNIITLVKGSLEAGRPLKLVNDQFRTPTFVEDLAGAIGLLIGKKEQGLFHVSGDEIHTPYDLGIAVAQHLGLDESLIEPVDAGCFSQPGLRPPRTGFCIDKAKEKLGFKPRGIEEALQLIWPQ